MAAFQAYPEQVLSHLRMLYDSEGLFNCHKSESVFLLVAVPVCEAWAVHSMKQIGSCPLLFECTLHHCLEPGDRLQQLGFCCMHP